METCQDYGITPSTHAPCGAAINRLLKTHRGVLFFPAGTYLIEETLRLPSDTYLKLHQDAIFKLAEGAAKTADDYLLCNADPEAGNQNITLEGGCFDGNQLGNPRPEGLFAEGYSGTMIHFRKVTNLKLLDLKLTNAEAYYTRFTHVSDFHIEGILFDSDHVRHNNDGIHLGGNCSHGRIRNLRAVTPLVPGDDMVALNADDALTRNEVRGMTNGPITDIQIENLEAHSCHTFVRMLSVFSPIQNIKVRNLKGGCCVSAINADGARGCRVPVYDEQHPPTPDGVGLLENITIDRVSVSKQQKDNTHGLIDLQERVRNFELTGFQRNVKDDLCLDAPSLRLKHVVLEKGTIDHVELQALNTHPPHEAYEYKENVIQTLQLDCTVCE